MDWDWLSSKTGWDKSGSFWESFEASPSTAPSRSVPSIAKTDVVSVWQSSRASKGVESVGKPLEIFLQLSGFGVIKN